MSIGQRTDPFREPSNRASGAGHYLPPSTPQAVSLKFRTWKPGVLYVAKATPTLAMNCRHVPKSPEREIAPATRTLARQAGITPKAAFNTWKPIKMGP